MGKPMLGTSQGGQPMHYSVGALVEQDGKYLLIDRMKPPYGFAGLAGHIDAGEGPDKALVREVREESGLRIKSHTLLCEEELGWNECSKGVGVHYWYLFRCTVSGKLKKNTRETKSIGWYSAAELRQLQLEPVWQYWFEKLGIV